MVSAIQVFLQEAILCIYKQNGQGLANLLSLESVKVGAAHSADDKHAIKSHTKLGKNTKSRRRNSRLPLDQMPLAHQPADAAALNQSSSSFLCLEQLQVELNQMQLDADESIVPLHLWNNLISGHWDQSTDENGEENKGMAGPATSAIWLSVLSGHLEVVRALNFDLISQAINCQSALVYSFHRLFQGFDRWALPILFVLNEDLWKLTHAALLSSRVTQTVAEETARIINKSFVLCINDRSVAMHESRKWGTLRLVALLFRIYFAIGQLNLCNNVLKAIQASELPDFGRFPAAQLVTFRYFLGKYYFIAENYTKADEELTSAMAQCHVRSLKNKRLILHYLIPTRLVLSGEKPYPSLLNRYDMNSFYVPALMALWRGDLQAYQSLLDQYETSLQTLGTYLVFERLWHVAYRNLLRRIWMINDKSSRLYLPSIASILVASHYPAEFTKPDKESTIEQSFCIVANLIARNMIRGYLAHEKGYLVLSQKDPFPAINSALVRILK